MFFLLAAFMLVSLSMVNLKGVPVELPTATSATAETSRNQVNITVDKAGLVYLDRQPIGANELIGALAALRATNASLRVFISGDREARHGDVLRVLDLARGAGIERVAFEVREPRSDAAH